MSFYVTLPSDASLDLFNNNSLTNYTTRLKLPIKVQVPYEVALVEITLCHDQKVEYGRIHYYKTIEAEKHKLPPVFDEHINLIHNDGETFGKMIDDFNKNIKQKIITKEKEKLKIKYGGNKKGDSEINKEVDIISKPLIPKIIFENNFLSFKTPPDCNFVFDGELAYKMGLPIGAPLKTNSEKINLSHFDTNFTYLHLFYIYTDIIKYQYVGDTLAPLLRTVLVQKFGSPVTSVFDSPHYIPLNGSNIETININIRDNFGNLIKYLKSRTIVKLHFRPIKYGF